MSRVVVSEFVSVDGVIEDPGGAEGFEHGGWALRFDRGPEGNRFKLDETFESEALLLGRVTYEGFAEAWPSRTDDVGFADKMNTMLKFVVSSTLERLDWSNSSLLTGDVVDEVAKLKQKPGGDILVAGSAQLARTLLQHDLVDELRLMVFPVVLGRGKRLFAEDGEMAVLELADARTVGAGVVILVYRRPGADAA